MGPSILTFAAPILFSLTAADVTVHVAPDQPAPHVYVDEPLIIEFSAEQDTTVPVSVEIVSASGVEATIDLGDLRLEGNTPAWKTLHDAPVQNGTYGLQFTIGEGEDTRVVERKYCRIGRPFAGPTLSLVARGDSLSVEDFQALRALPLRMLRFSSSVRDMGDRVHWAHHAGFRVAVALGAESLEAMAGFPEDEVQQWQFDGATPPDELLRSLRSVARNAPEDSRALVVQDLAQLTSLLAQGGSILIDTVVLPAEEDDGALLSRARRAAESMGVEGLRYVSLLPVNEEFEPGGLIRALITHRAGGFARTIFDAGRAYRDGTFGPEYVELSAFAHVMSGTEYMGPLPFGEDLQAEVFRRDSRGSSQDGETSWVAVVWNASDTGDAVFPAGDGTTARQMDATGNDLGVLEPSEGEVALKVSPSPRYVFGVGGALPALAAKNRVSNLAGDILADDALTSVMDDELITALEALGDMEEAESKRYEFFELVRALPGLERQWHEGIVSRDQAVPAIAALARLARRVATLEHETGEVFLEPLRETLARCGEYLSLYLTGTGGARGSDTRGDWLLDEVTRLTAEARTLASNGRRIEADAVAALAEWRARSLQHAYPHDGSAAP